MRLWHKELIPVLPRQQLLGQWRECCLIAKNIAEIGTPNHILVNKIMEYQPKHFYNYCDLIRLEMKNRGYRVNWPALEHWLGQQDQDSLKEFVPLEELFKGWHDGEYFRICFYNLREKNLCGGISKSEWLPIECAAIKNGRIMI